MRNGAAFRCLEAVGQAIAYGMNTKKSVGPLVGMSVFCPPAPVSLCFVLTLCKQVCQLCTHGCFPGPHDHPGQSHAGSNSCRCHFRGTREGGGQCQYRTCIGSRARDQVVGESWGLGHGRIRRLLVVTVRINATGRGTGIAVPQGRRVIGRITSHCRSKLVCKVPYNGTLMRSRSMVPRTKIPQVVHRVDMVHSG